MQTPLFLDQLPGRTVSVAGAEYLYCSGTAYLGIPHHETFRQTLLEGFAAYGTNYASSRMGNLQLRVFEEAETYIATLTGAEAALTLSSGYLTAQTVVRLLADAGELLYAPRTHPALWRTSADFSNQPFHEWIGQLPGYLQSSTHPHPVIVTNSVDPLLAQQYDFSWVQQLPGDKQLTLLVDDSHGLGIIGKNGAGIFPELQLLLPPHVRLIVVGSFGKAFGIPGGVILADKKTIDNVRKSPFFGASSPIIPAYLYAFLRSANVYRQEREKLFRNIARFHELTAKANLFQTFPQYPVFYTPHNELYPYLEQHGVLVSSFPYPSPDDARLTRIVLSSLHTMEDIERLAQLVNKF